MACGRKPDATPSLRHLASQKRPPLGHRALSADFPLGDSLEVSIRREDAERCIEEVLGDDPDVAAKLRVEERELEAGGVN